jgi:adenosylmethionine-8-amino-7-oxononanoate aminotransferase
VSGASSVFSRGRGRLPVALSAKGAWITDTDGKQYLDAAGGAIAVGIGHGDEKVAASLAAQAGALDWVHASAFTTDPLEAYAAALARVVPVEGARVFPVSGGSEAVETALKMARAYHLARGDAERALLIARGHSYHGNTIGALDASGREPLRRPYEPWLGRTKRIPGVNEYRCPSPSHPDDCAGFHADALEKAILDAGPERVAAFIAEVVGGAASGAAVPPHGYWDRVREICARHGVLLLADEVMTGFGRTGEWFASDHFALQPDILIAAKGASSGYWPLGLAIASSTVHDTIQAAGGLVHGFTWSHHPIGARVGLTVLERIEELRLVDRARTQGERLLHGLTETLAGHRRVGDVRGLGLLACIELVENRETKRPFPRGAGVAEEVVDRAMDLGLLLYPSTGNVDGVDGDYLLLGPPLTIIEDEVDLIVERTSAAVGAIQ